MAARDGGLLLEGLQAVDAGGFIGAGSREDREGRVRRAGPGAGGARRVERGEVLEGGGHGGPVGCSLSHSGLADVRALAGFAPVQVRQRLQ